MLRRFLLLATISSSLLSASGCSMCCGVYDYDYPTYGGLVPRADRSYGRVGSVFSDPNASPGVAVAIGVEDVEAGSMRGRNLPDPIEPRRDPLPIPESNRMPNEDRDKPAEELRKELLRGLDDQTGSAAPRRMMVRPTQMLQQESTEGQIQRLGGTLDGRRLRALFR